MSCCVGLLTVVFGVGSEAAIDIAKESILRTASSTGGGRPRGPRRD